MHAIYVPLKTDVKAALLSRAQRQDRDPRREAARLIREVLERDGDLPDLKPVAGGPPDGPKAA